MSLISIIVPVYNTGKYLKKSIESVLYQTYEDLEVILVDDGSTDGSSAICDEYAQTDTRIKVIHKKNGGLSSARNAGIEIASGEYIAFVDSDDYILPNMYEKMLLEMKASESDIVMCSYLNVNESGCYLGKANIQEWTGAGIDFLKKDGLGYNYAWNKLFRRALFDDLRFPLGKYFEDIFIMHDVFYKAKKVSLIPDALYIYQQREGSISVDLTSCHRVDFIEALISRIEFLLKIGAEEKVIYHFIMQIYGVWNRFYQADMFKNPYILDSWERHYVKFRRATKGITRGWTFSHKLSLFLFRQQPQLLRILMLNYRRGRALASFGKKKILRTLRTEQARQYFSGNENITSYFPPNVYESEYRKYKASLKTDNAALILKRMEAFNSDDLILKADHLSLDDDPCVPTVLLIVKNELERIKLFYDHYHKLGVHQFVVLDNDSDDGTFEFLIKQQDTRVYQTSTKFQTQRKEGWIEKLLAMTGYHRWYIVVDSDELLDYIGSENHLVEDMIRKIHAAGQKRICGYMLDMYAKEALFGVDSESESIPEYYRFFDKEGYFTKGQRAYSSNYILGGPRLRMFGIVLVLSKQAVFYYDEQTLYRDCHSLFPVIPISEMPTLFVLRHYKFLNMDHVEYQRRIREKSFYGNSIEYRTIMQQLDKNREESMYYYDSQEYINSDSLRCLPYLEEVTW